MKFLMTILIVSASLIGYAGNGIITIEDKYIGGCFPGLGSVSHYVVVKVDSIHHMTYTIDEHIGMQKDTLLFGRREIASIIDVVDMYLKRGYTIKNIERIAGSYGGDRYFLVRKIN